MCPAEHVPSIFFISRWIPFLFQVVKVVLILLELELLFCFPYLRWFGISTIKGPCNLFILI